MEQLKSEIKNLNDALDKLTTQVTEEIKFRHEADTKQVVIIGRLEDSITTMAEAVTKVSQSMAVTISQNKSRDKADTLLREYIEKHLDKSHIEHRRMEKDGKSYTDSKAKNLRVAIEFRTKIAGIALAVIVSAASVVGHYIIEQFKEEIAFIRNDLKENELAISNLQK